MRYASRVAVAGPVRGAHESGAQAGLRAWPCGSLAFPPRMSAAVARGAVLERALPLRGQPRNSPECKGGTAFPFHPPRRSRGGHLLASMVPHRPLHSRRAGRSPAPRRLEPCGRAPGGDASGRQPHAVGCGCGRRTSLPARQRPLAAARPADANPAPPRSTPMTIARMAFGFVAGLALLAGGNAVAQDLAKVVTKADVEKATGAKFKDGWKPMANADVVRAGGRRPAGQRRRGAARSERTVRGWEATIKKMAPGTKVDTVRAWARTRSIYSTRADTGALSADFDKPARAAARRGRGRHDAGAGEADRRRSREDRRPAGRQVAGTPERRARAPSGPTTVPDAGCYNPRPFNDRTPTDSPAAPGSARRGEEALHPHVRLPDERVRLGQDGRRARTPPTA